jgi:hypothetical protein
MKKADDYTWKHRLDELHTTFNFLLMSLSLAMNVSSCFSLEEETKLWLESGGKPEIQQTKPKTYEVVSSRISVVYKPTTQEDPPVLPQVIQNIIFV